MAIADFEELVVKEAERDEWQDRRHATEWMPSRAAWALSSWPRVRVIA
ncbi:MAG TPA: hypothetical protein VFU71_18120 [Burkholderiaceae bacterium]|nr:hypothetical protein [Burkholderiaceae bacterium]